MSEKNENNNKLPFNVAVLVVGDLNRSPRMLNHCIALTEAFPNINEISLIGYNGGDIRSDISNNSKIKQYHIHQGIKKTSKIIFYFCCFNKNNIANIIINMDIIPHSKI